MNNFEIQPLTDDLLESAADAYMRAFKETGEDWSQQTALEFVKYMWGLSSDTFYVAVADGAVIGGVWGVIKPWLDGKHLADIELFVHPEHQEQGISLHLYKNLLEYSIEKYNIVEMEGVVDGTKEFPMSYYKSLGRKESGHVHLVGDPNEVLQNVNSKLKDRE